MKAKMPTSAGWVGRVVAKFQQAGLNCGGQQTNDWLRCVKLVGLGWTELLGAQSGELGRWCGIVLWEEQSRVFLLGI